MTELSIVPECYVDTKVAEIISQAKRKYNHQPGSGNVANQLKNRLINIPALGIIDEDKNKGPVAKYFSEFDLITQKDGLLLKKHQARNQFLIIVCPEIENWLLNNSVIVNLHQSLSEYNLPDNLKDLKKITKAQSIDDNIGFYRFIKELVKRDAPGIITLKNWIEKFKESGTPFY